MRPRRVQRQPQYRDPTYRDLVGRLAASIRHLRERRGWTQEETAELCAMPVRLVQQIEAGETNATLTTLARLAKGFAIDGATLLRARPPKGRPARVK